jgi:hypothetical protein
MRRTPMALVLCALAGAAHADPPRPAYLPSSTARQSRAAPGLALRREPGKGWVYEHPGFLARVAEDGTVRFEDRHGEIHLALPLPLPLPEGTPTLEGTLRKLGKSRPRPRTPAPELPPMPLERMSPYRPSPSEWCVYPHPCFFVARIVLINAVGTFDINDEILRLNGQDPYRNQKAAFLGSTLTFRQELGQRASVRAREKALNELRARLVEIDEDPRLDPQARRAAIQALADDLDPDPAVAAPARALLDAHLAPAVP